MSGAVIQQLVTTIAAGAGTLGAGAAVYWPFRKRRDERLARRVVERDTALRATIRGEFVAQSEQIKADTIARIDESDRATHDQIAEVKADVLAVKTHIAETDLRMAVQFGGNGGGMRQALNEQGQQIAHLVGRFDEHLRSVSR